MKADSGPIRGRDVVQPVKALIVFGVITVFDGIVVWFRFQKLPNIEWQAFDWFGISIITICVGLTAAAIVSSLPILGPHTRL